MARVLIEHPVDGRRYSVTPEAHERLYPDFVVVGATSPADFVATGIPEPKKVRTRPRAKTAARPAAKPVGRSKADVPRETGTEA